MSPGELLVFVLISIPHEGQIVWVEWGPRGMIVVTMCWAVRIGCCGVRGAAALTPFTADERKFVNIHVRLRNSFVYLVHSSVARWVAARIRKVVGRFCSFCFVLF